ncbi:hypothetical protein [Humibacter ginsengiterrae]
MHAWQVLAGTHHARTSLEFVWVDLLVLIDQGLASQRTNAMKGSLKLTMTEPPG